MPPRTLPTAGAVKLRGHTDEVAFVAWQPARGRRCWPPARRTGSGRITLCCGGRAVQGWARVQEAWSLT